MASKSLVTVCLLMIAGFGLRAQDLAPGFSGIDLQTGDQINLADYRGRVVYLDFWASWCLPCLVSLPAYQQLHADHQSDDWIIVAVNVDEDTRDGLDFLEGVSVTYPVIADTEGEIGIPYGIRSLPVSFLIDQQGMIVRRYRGFESGDEVEIFADIQELVNN